MAMSVRDLAAQFLALAEKQGTTVPLMIGHRLMGISLLHTGDIAEGERISIARSRFTILPSIVRWRRDLAKTPGWQSCLSVDGLVDAWLSRGRAGRCRLRAQGCARDRPSRYFDVSRWAGASYDPIFCGNYAAANAHLDELVALADEKDAAMWKADRNDDKVAYWP